MFLRKVRLRTWGCHDDLSVAFGPGMNVCVGPNGTGKSTLYHAIFATLTLKHNTARKDAGAFERWGTTGFGPNAILEIVRGAEAWRLSKTYLHDASCLLEREQSGGWTAHGKNQRAEEIVDGWLEQDGAAGRLILALWSLQADPTQVFEAPTTKTAGRSRATMVEEVIANVARPDATGPFSALKRGVDRQYLERFTPVRKDFKSGSEVDRARLEVEKAIARLDDLRLRRESLAAKADEYKRLDADHKRDSSERDRLKAERDERGRTAERFRAQSETLAELDRRAERLGERVRQQQADDDRRARAELDFQRAVADVDALRSAYDRATRQHAAAEEAVARAEARLHETIPRLDRLSGEFEARDRLRQAIAESDDRGRRLERSRGEHARALAACDDAARQLRDAQAALERAKEVREAVARADRRRLRVEAEAACRLAERELEAAEATGLVAERTRRLEQCRRVREAREELDRLDPNQLRAPLPPVDVLAGLKRQRDALSVLEQTLGADALSVRFEVERRLRVAFAKDREASEVRDLSPGEVVVTEGVAGVTLAIEGVGRLEFQRTSPESSARLERRERARLDLATELERWEASDLAELEDRRRLHETRRTLEQRVESALNGDRLEDLEARLAAIDRRLLEIGPVPAIEPGEPPGRSPDLGLLRSRCERARQAVLAAQAACRDAEEADDPRGLPDATTAGRLVVEAQALRETLANRVQATEVARARAESDLEHVRSAAEAAARALADEAQGDDPAALLGESLHSIADLLAELATFDAVPGGAETRASIQLVKERVHEDLAGARATRARSHEERSEVRRRLAVAEEKAKGLGLALEALRDGVAGAGPSPLESLRDDWHRAIAEANLLRANLPPDPGRDAVAFEARWEACQERCRAGDVALANLRGELGVLGGEGLDTQHALAEEHLERCQDRFEALRNDAAAWALLHHLLAEVEADQSRGIATRVEGLAADLVTHLTGGSAEGVTFDPKTLAPIRARARSAGLDAEIERFSRGTREQVALACRLQIGLLLGQQSRQMILLDDPLAHTDASRHGMALETLERMAERLQLIIFTCHEDRYRPLWDRDATRRIAIDPRPLPSP